MRYLLVYNPVSGKIRTKTKRLGQIVDFLGQGGNEVVVYQTQDKDDAREYCKKVKKNIFDKIICCGGDGTLHEVINGIMLSKFQIPIAYIPAGSTNDYAKNLGITANNALQCAKSDNFFKLDIGNFNGEYFSYVAAFGAFTEVSFSTSQKNKNTLGYLAYLLEGVKSLSSIKPIAMKVIVEQEIIEDQFLLGMFTNATSVAGMKNKHGRNTKLDDGMLEYLLIKMPQNFLELQHIIADLLIANVKSPLMYYGQASKYEIESESVAWTLDGENGGCVSKVKIETSEKAIVLNVGKKLLQ